MASLDGAVVVVTGSASGIGAACVVAARERGATVVAVDRTPQEPADGVMALVADVTDPAQVDAVGQAVAERHGRCDALITSAGIAPVGSATACTLQEWDDAFAINARGTWLACRALLPLLAADGGGGGGGSIVTIASGAGLRPHGDLAAYSASKAAVIALTRSIALGYGPSGVRANCVCPGIVDTPLNDSVLATRGADEEALERLLAGTALRRLGKPEEIAAAVLFLAGPEAAMITGATLAADAGRVLH